MGGDKREKDKWEGYIAERRVVEEDLYFTVR